MSLGEKGELVHVQERERGKSTEPPNVGENLASRIEAQNQTNNSIFLLNNVLTFETVAHKNSAGTTTASITPSRISFESKKNQENPPSDSSANMRIHNSHAFN